MNKNVGLTQENTKSLKGLLALAVLFHHLIGKVNIISSPILLMSIGASGYWAVAGFFFISGYGLWKSYAKKENYIKEFPLKRLLPFFLSVIVFTIVYILFYLIFKIDHKVSLSFFAVIKSFFWGSSLISNGWYLQVQLWIYIFFYLVFSQKVKEDTHLILIVLALLCYYFLGLYYGVSIHKFLTTPAFAVGLYFGRYEQKVSKYFKQNIKSFLLMLSLFILLFVTRYILGKNNCEIASHIMITFESLLFVFTLLCVIEYDLFEKILSFRSVKFLGKISLSIYALHGMFLIFYRSHILFVKNDWLYILLVTTSTIILSVFITPIIEKIYSICRTRKS